MPLQESLMDQVLPETRIPMGPEPFPQARHRSRVLVVEDDEEMRALVEEILQEEGYLTAGAPDTFSALIHLLAEGADVVVTDWKMPVMDGLALLDSVRRSQPGLPVIFITAHASHDLLHRALEHGAAGFLAKPFRRQEILAHVRAALGVADSPVAGDRTLDAGLARARPEDDVFP